MAGPREVVNALFAALARGDAEGCRRTAHPEFRYESKLTPVLGLDAIVSRDEAIHIFLNHLPATFDDFSLEHFEMTELGPNTVMCGVRYAGRGRQSGASVEQLFWKVFTLADDRLLSVVEYESRDAALNAARAHAAAA